MPLQIWTRAELDARTPEEGLFLESSCHPDHAIRAHYEEGILTLRCRACASIVCRLAVAERV